MRRFQQFLFSLLAAAPLSAAAQKASVTISGYITEGKSGERLIGATALVSGSDAAAVSNSFGFYSLTVPAADTLYLQVGHSGQETQYLSLPARRDTVLNLRLDAPTALSEVVVQGRTDAIHQRTAMSTIDIPIETIKGLPAFLGEVDIMKVIQLLPGIQAGSEGSSGIYVRGGGPDQNLILLDGVPVYNASHLFGFFSVFNADAIKGVSVIKGGFPARYGGRLSSVIDINMKEGDNNAIHGEGGIGLIASRLTLEGPIQKGKSSFMVSGRRTYIDILAKPLMPKDEKFGYYFYDLNGKVNFTLGRKDHIYASGYFGNDKFYTESENNDSWSGGTSKFKTGLQWGNLTGVARWNHEFSPRLFGNLTTYYTRYRFLVSAEDQSRYPGSTDQFLLRYASGINDLAVKYDFDFIPVPAHAIKAGVGYIAHKYSPSAIQTKQEATGTPTFDTTIGDPSVRAGEIDAYIEDDFRISSKLKANLGVHWTGFAVRNSFFNAVQPRASLRYLITDRLSAKASYVQMAQFIHLLTNSSIGLPTDLWLPATEKVPPQRSWQTAAGLAYTHPNGVELSLEGYYKDMRNVIEYREGASFFSSSTRWEEKVTAGRGWSYGAEVFLQKKKGRLSGMAGYTLSWTNRQFDNLNGGLQFPYRYDRRHDLKLAAVYSLTKRIDLSAEWVYGTGNAITIPVGAFPGASGEPVTIYGPRNGYRMPAYHRGDISAKFRRMHKRYESAWVISVYNVYNRQNPFFIYQDGGNFKQVSLFPILPSISWQAKF